MTCSRVRLAATRRVVAGRLRPLLPRNPSTKAIVCLNTTGEWLNYACKLILLSNHAIFNSTLGCPGRTLRCDSYSHGHSTVSCRTRRDSAAVSAYLMTMDVVSSFLLDPLTASSHRTRFSTVPIVISRISYPLLVTTAITLLLFFLGSHELIEPTRTPPHESIELPGRRRRKLL